MYLLTLATLNLFDAGKAIKLIFYNLVICSVWTYCLLCWFGNADKKVNKLTDDSIKQACKIVNDCLLSVNTM